MLKKIFLSILIILLALFGWIGFGFYLMEIDDHYGDLQEVYFDSKSGDIIVNKQTRKFGVITKSWKRAYIITRKNDTLDLYELIYTHQGENKYEVFRSENELKIKDLTFDKIVKLKEEKLIKTIIKN